MARTMVADVPEIKVAQYLFNDRKFFNKADDFHFTEELNESFSVWLRNDYYHKLHTGINERTIDRLNRSSSHMTIS